MIIFVIVVSVISVIIGLVQFFSIGKYIVRIDCVCFLSATNEEKMSNDTGGVASYVYVG
jgi:hypothetical protein